MPRKHRTVNEIKIPTVFNWRTTDEEETERRRQRAQAEMFSIRNLEATHPIFSNFEVKSGSGLHYSVEIRDIAQRQFSCECVDFRINGLGTCKHVEAVLLLVAGRHKRLFKEAVASGSGRIEIGPDPALGKLRVTRGLENLPGSLRKWFTDDGVLTTDDVEDAVARLAKADEAMLRISQDTAPWLESRRRTLERKQLRKEYELKVHSGEWPVQETTVPLFPYQREGMLHLAFTERALLADEMGLGKTIQAIAACALLHRLGKAKRVLVVTPASLKTEWEDQIQRFTALPYQLIFGGSRDRLKHYADPPFFTIVNYEQMVRDALDVNHHLKPDVVVLDEAQRIKNWSTLTAQAVKRLRSRYAFVLTGTPIENRIDELHSLMDFLEPSVLGPLFRFNRDFYVLDDRGRPKAYQNLNQLHDRVKPFMLRRRKAEVETELPDRTDKNFFVPLSPGQKTEYEMHEDKVARIAANAKRRPLTQKEQDMLMRELAMMRMVCDTNYILNPDDKVCPKLGELEKVLEECRDNKDVKVIVFSEWERMLQLVKDLCQKRGLGFAWHTGSVPQLRRRGEINLFKTDPNCRVFLTTDSGSTGLNLQNASVVVNCDLPWNPAKLEQRIARAWRKNQTRPVTVINLVSENTIEHRMLGTLANKQALSDGVLDLKGDLGAIKMGGGKQAFLDKLAQLIRPAAPTALTVPPASKPLPVDRARAFAEMARAQLSDALCRCEEQFPVEGSHSLLLVVVESNAVAHRQKLEELHASLYGPKVSDPLAETYLEVVDRATADALERLTKAGVIQRTSRGSRPLLGGGSMQEVKPQLSDEEKELVRNHRTQAARKLRMGQILLDNELSDESRDAFIEATRALGSALAIENHLPAPSGFEDLLSSKFAFCWGTSLGAVKDFASDQQAQLRPFAPVLQQLLRDSP